MPITHTEKSRSRTSLRATDTSSTSERTFAVWGSDDPEAIDNYILPLIPEYDGNGLVLNTVNYDNLGGGNWDVTASYTHPDASDEERELDVGDYEFSFDTGGGTTTRTVSLGTTSYPKSGETAPEWKGAIGVIKEANETRIDGVQIGISALKFSIRKRQPRTTITLEYVRTLKELTYTVNDAEWLGFAAGEVLFVGATGRQGTESDPEITYNFIVSDNATSLTVGDITVTTKPGHDYLWVFFEDIEDTSADMTVKQPKAAYVEQVYERTDFDELQI